MAGKTLEHSLVIEGNRLPAARVMAVLALISKVIRVVRVLLLEFRLTQECIHIQKRLAEQFLCGRWDIVARLADGFGTRIATVTMATQAFGFPMPVGELEFIMGDSLV